MEAKSILRKPDWIRVGTPSGGEWRRIGEVLKKRGLHTVCDEARCPNKAECWGCGTATFMILGDVCTRGCRFCAVATAREGRPVRDEEADELAEAVAELGLRHAVLTSVDRDDLADRGSAHFASCVRKIKERSPGVKVELLIPDYVEGEIEAVMTARPDVVAHNVETVRRLQGVRDARASFDTSLRTLSLAKRLGAPLTKSSLLLGLGETRDEVLAAMDELRAVDVGVLVLGQYLQPSKKQLDVVEYIEPAAFQEYAAEGRDRGFSTVVSGPFARTSYHAMDAAERAAKAAAGEKDDDTRSRQTSRL
jgi:lipoyl synthase